MLKHATAVMVDMKAAHQDLPAAIDLAVCCYDDPVFPRQGWFITLRRKDLVDRPSNWIECNLWDL